MMTTRLVAASAALLLLGGTMASAQSADGDFARFVDDYFDARFADRPSEGTAAGLHQYDAKLEDVSAGAIATARPPS